MAYCAVRAWGVTIVTNTPETPTQKAVVLLLVNDFGQYYRLFSCFIMPIILFRRVFSYFTSILLCDHSLFFFFFFFSFFPSIEFSFLDFRDQFAQNNTQLKIWEQESKR